MYKPVPSLTMEVTLPPSAYTVSSLDSAANANVLLTFKVWDELLSEDIWNAMPVPSVRTTSQVDIYVGRGHQRSTFIVYLRQKDNDRFNTSVGSVPLYISAELDYDGEHLTRSDTVTVGIADDIGWRERWTQAARPYLPWVLGGLVVFALALVYLRLSARHKR